MLKHAILFLPLLLLPACTARDMEPEVKAAVAKQFGAREQLIFLVPAKDKQEGYCGMYGHPATEAEPFERPKPFLYKEGRFLKLDSADADRQHFLDQCLGKVPVLVPEVKNDGRIPISPEAK